jgi:hypothetical protein
MRRHKCVHHIEINTTLVNTNTLAGMNAMTVRQSLRVSSLLFQLFAERQRNKSEKGSAERAATINRRLIFGLSGGLRFGGRPFSKLALKIAWQGSYPNM